MENDTRWTASVRVKSSNGFAGVFAAKKYMPGDRLLPLRGRVSPTGSRYSIQTGVGRHIEPDLASNGNSAVPAPWKFLNHSCEPNLEINLEEECFVACREIAAGEELNFDYLTTEWEMASPFDCNCGSSSCRGMIRGFKHLSPEQQEQLLPAAAPHIRLLYGQNGAAENKT